MAERGASVVLITHQHRIAGAVQTKGKRLLDVLNDKTTDYLDIRDVQVFRGTDTETCVAAFPEALALKADISLMVVLAEKHEAPRKRLYGFVRKRPYPVFITVPGYEIQGRMHLTGPPEPLAVLARETDVFFPVTQATVSQVITGEPLEVSVVMVNKTCIGLFSLGEEPIAS
jgi:hypothetical protein